MDGTSFAYTFDDADAPERHTQQYFEIYGNRAIYKDGWWAGAKLDRIPWDATPATIGRFAPGVYDPEGDRWELYYLPDDYSQARDLAAEQPEKLAELKALFWQEAEANNVLPADGRILGVLRDPAADAHRHHHDLLRRRREHRLGDDPPHLRALLRHRGRAARTRRWGRGRYRGRS